MEDDKRNDAARDSTMIKKRIVMDRSNQQFLEASNWAESSQAELWNSEEAGLLLKDAETGYRGHVLTGDTTFLVPLNNAVAVLPDKFTELTSQNFGHPSVKRTIHRKSFEKHRLFLDWH